VTEEVTIAGESGDRVTIERNVVSEHVVYRSDIGVWPKDRPSQRAWALSAVIQHQPTFATESNWDEMFAEAQRIVNWVQDGRAK